MFIINLTYKVDLTEVDKHLADHVAYLQQQYANQTFIASGRKVPRTGGVILSQLTDKKQLMEILAQDPFNIHDLADYQIIEFIPSMTSEKLAFLKET